MIHMRIRLFQRLHDTNIVAVYCARLKVRIVVNIENQNENIMPPAPSSADWQAHPSIQS